VVKKSPDLSSGGFAYTSARSRGETQTSTARALEKCGEGARGRDWYLGSGGRGRNPSFVGVAGSDPAAMGAGTGTRGLGTERGG
jgi:hypothetical protein